MSNFRARLTTARQKARTLIAEGHVSRDIGDVVEDLLDMTVELERQLGSAEGQSGDVRVLRSRNDQLSADLKRKDQEMSGFRKQVVDVVIGEIKAISAEVAKILAATQTDQDGAVYQAGKTIGQRLRSLVESLTKQ